MPVIVLGTGVTALGALRILGRGGLEPIVTEPRDPLLKRSRWYRAFPDTVPPLTTQPLSEWLRELPLDRAVLLPCSDKLVAQTAELPAELADRFPASVPSAKILRRFIDKGQFAELLQTTRTPHPFSKTLEAADDLDDVPDGVFESAMLKPRDSQSFMAHFRTKALYVTSRDEAASQLEVVQAAGFDVILQEYILGPATQHYFVDGFVDRGGVIRATFVRQRLRMFPSDFGNSTAMISLKPSEATPAVEAISALLTAASYRGIFSAEFKRDARDGMFKILEVNTRAWWYVDFAARCGVDVCRMAYEDALGHPLATTTEYRVGESLVFPYHDFFACRALQREHRLSAWGWIRSWAGAMQPVFQLADPIPGLAAGVATLGRFAMNRVRRLLPNRRRLSTN